MRKIVRIFPLLVIPALLLAFMPGKPKDTPKKFISIEQALKEKLITASFTGKGGHQGECIDLEIKSLSPKDTIIRIEPGRRLVAKDSILQDILIIKEVQLFLASGEKKEISLFGFCCEATNSSPSQGAGFTVGYMEDSTFIVLAEFLSRSNLPLGVMQSSVWVLSNGHSFNSIANENENDKPKMKELFQLLARIKKMDYHYPWYSLKFRQDSGVLFSNRPVKFFGEFEYIISTSANVDLVIRTAQNLFVKNIFVNRPHHPDKYIHRFSYDVTGWPKGKYYMILYVDNQQKAKREFEL